MKCIIPARSIAVEQQLRILYGDLGILSYDLEHSYSMTDEQFNTTITAITTVRKKTIAAREELRLLLEQVKPVGKGRQ